MMVDFDCHAAAAILIILLLWLCAADDGHLLSCHAYDALMLTMMLLC